MTSADLTQPTITRSKLTIETLEQDAKKKKKNSKLTMKTPERRQWRDMLHQSFCRNTIYFFMEIILTKTNNFHQNLRVPVARHREIGLVW